MLFLYYLLLLNQKKKMRKEDNDKESKKNVHQGHNVALARWLNGMKQEDLAEKLDISQKSVSIIENQRIIEDSTLYLISQILGYPILFFKTFKSEDLINYYTYNTYKENSLFNEFSTDSLNQQIQNFNLDGGNYTNNFNNTINSEYVKLCNDIKIKQEEIEKFLKKNLAEKNKEIVRLKAKIRQQDKTIEKLTLSKKQ